MAGGQCQRFCRSHCGRPQGIEPKAPGISADRARLRTLSSLANHYKRQSQQFGMTVSVGTAVGDRKRVKGML